MAEGSFAFFPGRGGTACECRWREQSPWPGSEPDFLPAVPPCPPQSALMGAFVCLKLPQFPSAASLTCSPTCSASTSATPTAPALKGHTLTCNLHTHDCVHTHHTYICTCTHMHRYTHHTHMAGCVYTHYTHMHMHTRMHRYTHHIHMLRCVCVHIIHICMCTHAYAKVHTAHTRAQVCTLYTHAHVYTRCIHTCIYITHIFMCAHMSMYTCSRAHVHVFTCTCHHTCACSPIHIHPLLHTLPCSSTPTLPDVLALAQWPCCDHTTWPVSSPSSSCRAGPAHPMPSSAGPSPPGSFHAGITVPAPTPADSPGNASAQAVPTQPRPSTAGGPASSPSCSGAVWLPLPLSESSSYVWGSQHRPHLPPLEPFSGRSQNSTITPSLLRAQGSASRPSSVGATASPFLVQLCVLRQVT